MICLEWSFVKYCAGYYIRRVSCLPIPAYPIARQHCSINLPAKLSQKNKIKIQHFVLHAMDVILLSFVARVVLRVRAVQESMHPTFLFKKR